MSEVKRYFWNSDNLDGFGYGSMDSLADASSQELVCAYDFDAALAREASETLRANEAERREAALREELETQDRLLRSSVPVPFKDATSPVGAVQSYIAELELTVSSLARTESELDNWMFISANYANGRQGVCFAIPAPQGIYTRYEF